MELETRSCGCGCGCSFRCLPTSTARFISKAHEHDAKRNGRDMYRAGNWTPGRRGRPSKQEKVRRALAGCDLGYSG